MEPLCHDDDATTGGWWGRGLFSAVRAIDTILHKKHTERFDRLGISSGNCIRPSLYSSVSGSTVVVVIVQLLHASKKRQQMQIIF